MHFHELKYMNLDEAFAESILDGLTNYIPAWF